MKKRIIIKVDNKDIEVNGERNLLEIIRKANIELPTFCYYSEMSIYGACRMCMVDVEGRGLVPACSTLPEDGMKVRTSTDEIRNMRKIVLELLLASHSSGCSTCNKSSNCQLQSLARRMGVNEVRFKKVDPSHTIDKSSPSLVRDPNKCILCGDCVRMCSEIQQIGAIDFAYRGSESKVVPAFEKDLSSVECVYCGQCARVCPTGALMPKSNIENFWRDIHDKDKYVVVQIAPAVRVAVGEAFGMPVGDSVTGQIVSAIKSLGADKVFDTSFTADLTVIEESNEFIDRYTHKQRMPLFTSCCPAWVKYVEQYYPEFLKNLSSCKSPQQMFGSVCKEEISRTKNIDKKNIIVVSIMPCTAKKFEAARPEFNKDGVKEVDYVITTQELITMIEEAGLQFNNLEPHSFDMPFGFKTGAGVIFGNSGGVTEAVLRYATEEITKTKTENYEFKFVRGEEGIRTANVNIDGNQISIAIVSGLGNAKKVIEGIKTGELQFDFVEVMACSGGCIGGAGQPVCKDTEYKLKRTRGLFENDKMQVIHKSQDNPYIDELYEKMLEAPASKKSHEFLHTHYYSRKRIMNEGVTLVESSNEDKVDITVCFGTGCIVRGAQELIKDIMNYVKENDLNGLFEIKASFCYEKCDRGPVVKIGENVYENSNFDEIVNVIKGVIVSRS